MPKVRKHEWEGFADPDSGDHDPTPEEIAESNRIKDIALSELQFIEREIENPRIDPYSGKESKIRAADPDDLLSQLSYIKSDYFNSLRDPQVKQELVDRMKAVERKIYKQFIPFLETSIYRFGWKYSPLEQTKPQFAVDADEIRVIIERAEQEGSHAALSKKEQLEFAIELMRVRGTFERYEREPSAFTFERIEEETQTIISKIVDEEVMREMMGENRVNARTLDSIAVQEQTKKTYETLSGKAHLLQEIASRMLDTRVKTACAVRADEVFSYVEYLKAKSEAPRELLSLEGELTDQLQNAEQGKPVSEELVGKTRERLEKLRDERLGYIYQKFIEKLLATVRRIEQVISGDTENAEELPIDIEDGVDWAWSALGVSRSATWQEIRAAYFKLVNIYHPDKNKAESALERIKIINRAYELLERMERRKNTK